MSPRIAIVGAGPAGLCLARILLQNGIDSFTIFEKERTAHERSQGGTLDLHEKSGQLALRKAGLFDAFLQYARYDGEDLVLLDLHGHRHIDKKGGERGRPEIDRIRLRQILLESLPADKIRWGCHLLRAEPGALHFDHGSETGFDLIVGADGAWSKVRPIICDVPPFYSGISGYDTRISDVDEKHPEIAKIVGRGSYFAFGDEEGACILSQRNGDGSVKFYPLWRAPEDWVSKSGVDHNDIQDVRRYLHDRYREWAPEFHKLIDACDENVVSRPLYMLPPGLRWPSHKSVTVIGDAAHLMTPFAGQGVNIALADAMILAELVVKQPTDIGKAIAEYEKQMFKHAQQATTRTWDNLLDRFEVGGVEKFVKMAQAHVPAKKEEESREVPAAELSKIHLDGSS